MENTHFEKWLSNRGLLEKFKHNIEKTGIHYTDYYMFLKWINKEHYILRSFTWNITKEGEDFWEKIDFEWRNCLNRNML